MARKKRKPERRKRGTGTLSWDDKRQRWRAIPALGTGSKYFAAREDAARWLDAQGTVGATPEPPQTMRRALLTYTMGRDHVRPTTAKREDFATAHVNTHLGDLLVAAVNVADIAAMDKALRKTLAGGSVKGILSYLSGFYEHLIGYETPGITRNPVRNYLKRTPSRAREGTPTRKVQAMDSTMCRLLITALAGDPYQPHVCWLLCTGMRVSELAGLRWVNVGPDVIRIVEQRREDDRTTPAALKTERQLGEGRIIPLAKGLLALLPRGDDLVFPGYDGARFNRRGLATHLTDACRRVGLPHTTIHGLRHTANSGWADLGLNESGCAALLGHRRPSTTALYTHRSIAALRPVVEEWAGLVLGESQGKIVSIGA
jgi:integrase